MNRPDHIVYPPLHYGEESYMTSNSMFDTTGDANSCVDNTDQSTSDLWPELHTGMRKNTACGYSENNKPDSTPQPNIHSSYNNLYNTSYDNPEFMTNDHQYAKKVEQESRHYSFKPPFTPSSMSPGLSHSQSADIPKMMHEKDRNFKNKNSDSIHARFGNKWAFYDSETRMCRHNIPMESITGFLCLLFTVCICFVIPFSIPSCVNMLCESDPNSSNSPNSPNSPNSSKCDLYLLQPSAELSPRVAQTCFITNESLCPLNECPSVVLHMLKLMFYYVSILISMQSILLCGYAFCKTDKSKTIFSNEDIVRMV